MSGEVTIPESIKGKVLSVGPPVNIQEVDVYDRIQGINDRSAKIRRILDAWERQHTSERQMRQTYGKYLLWALALQGLLVNVAFFALGFGWIVVDPWIAKTFILAVFGEVAGMTFFVIKYLFPKTSADVLATLEKL
jgi:hypothetical protein